MQPKAESMIENEQATVLPWQDVLSKFLENEEVTFWLATVRDDGRPHLVPFGPAWVDGAIYFTMGQGTQKGKNLETNPNCSISFSVKGYDIIFEGRAAPVTDVPTLTRVAEVYATANGWPAYVHDGVLDAPYSAPTTGPAPYDVYKVALTKAIALGTTEETVYRATRFTFE